MNKVKGENRVFWVATGNAGKAREFARLLRPGLCYFLSDLKGYNAPEETGSSFEENARLKAYALKQYLQKTIWPAKDQNPVLPPALGAFDQPTPIKDQNPVLQPPLGAFDQPTSIKDQNPVLQPALGVLGEDSGLEVLALDGAPGIYSARYAGEQATDQDNLELLLKNMQGLPQSRRQACFVSHIVCLTPEGKEYSVEGRLPGRIALASQGHEGFGYDPIFVPEGAEGTMAQLGMTYKNLFSHRAKAVHRLLSSMGFSDKT